MTEAVFQFKSIKRILDRQEQKAEFEEKNPPAGFIRTISGALVHVDDAMTRPHGMAVPLMDQMGSTEAGRLTGGSCESVTLTTAQLPPYTLQHGESLTDLRWSEATAAALRSYVRMLIKI
jgi:hypothetical protein